jgi:hypothetical protein
LIDLIMTHIKWLSWTEVQQESNLHPEKAAATTTILAAAPSCTILFYNMQCTWDNQNK